MNNYRSIGKIVSSFGLKGELLLVHQLGKKTSLKGLEVIFIENKKDEMLPYFIQSARIKSDSEIFLQLEGIDVKESAKPLLQQQVWLTEEDFAKYTAKSSPIALLGFMVINEGEKLGVIDEVIEQPHQVLLSVKINDKEALIPLHEETLDNIDRKKKEVHVTLPDGLLEIYLE